MKLETLKKANELLAKINASEALVKHLQTLISKSRRLLVKASGEEESFYLDHEYVAAMLEIAQKRIESDTNELEAL